MDGLHVVVLGGVVEENDADNVADEDTLVALTDAGPAEDIVDMQ